MSDTFLLKGRLSITPPCTNTDTSGDFEITTDITESMALSKRHATVVSLTTDSIEQVNMADLASASVVMIKSTAPITVYTTTLAGTQQAISGVRFLLLLGSADPSPDPVTLLSVRRQPGMATSCRVILGEL